MFPPWGYFLQHHAYESHQPAVVKSCGWCLFVASIPHLEVLLLSQGSQGIPSQIEIALGTQTKHYMDRTHIRDKNKEHRKKTVQSLFLQKTRNQCCQQQSTPKLCEPSHCTTVFQRQSVFRSSAKSKTPDPGALPKLERKLAPPQPFTQKILLLIS